MVENLTNQNINEEESSKKYIIRIYDLMKVYNKGEVSQVIALNKVSLRLERGLVLAIAGPSGSGKSTLLNILGCMDSATSGRVLIDDIEITCLPEKDLAEIRKMKIGFIFQDFLLIPSLTALENVLLPLIPSGIKKGDRERAVEILKQVGLANRIKHNPKELSGGEKQRVAIARALINNPTIIFADEPTGNLDTKNGEEIIALLRKLNQTTGVTIIIVSHNPKIYEKADQLICLSDGSIEIPSS